MAEVVPLGLPLWSRRIAQKVDALSCERFHIHPLVLMEAAGRGVANVVEDCLTGVSTDGPVLVLSGAGNNGGDGLVVARYLADMGFDVRIFMVTRGKDAMLSDMCQRQLETISAIGLEVIPYQPQGLTSLFPQRSPVVIVDAILGLGFRGPLAKESHIFCALSEAAKFAESLIVAVDCPSALDVDNGGKQDVPLPANITVTFGACKPAHVISPARDLCGSVIDIDIGFPLAAAVEALEEETNPILLTENRDLLEEDPWRDLSPSAHKYDRGHVLVLGGSPGKTGAPLLAGLAALRCGAGWASVAMSKSAFATLKGEVPRELTFETLYQKEQEKIDTTALRSFLKTRRVGAVVCGPGWIKNELDAASFQVLAEFSRSGGFVALDAGATHNIDLLINKAGPLDPERWLLLPHPGEWRHLLGQKSEPLREPLDTVAQRKAQDYAQENGVTIIYKSATPITITGIEGIPVLVNDGGDATLARAGSGDVLAGLVAAHGCRGVAATLGANRAYAVLAEAARQAGRTFGENSVLAHNIIDFIGRVRSADFSGEDDSETDT